MYIKPGRMTGGAASVWTVIRCGVPPPPEGETKHRTGLWPTEWAFGMGLWPLVPARPGSSRILSALALAVQVIGRHGSTGLRSAVTGRPYPVERDVNAKGMDQKAPPMAPPTTCWGMSAPPMPMPNSGIASVR